MEQFLGREAESVKGRDKGRRYVVVKILDEFFLLVADGDIKTLCAPKRKNKKHIALTDKPERLVMDWTDSRQGDDRIKQFLSVANKEG